MTQADPVEYLEVVARLPSDQIATLRTRVEAIDPGILGIVIVGERQMLSARKSETIAQITIAFTVGVASSVVASALVDLFAHPAAARYNEISIGHVSVSVAIPDVTRCIESSRRTRHGRH